jgi:hypothetical protein
VSAVADPVALEDRFLAELRRRVAWQAEAAARLRSGQAAPVEPRVDVLDLRVLRRLVDGRPEAARHREWSAFLDELEELAEPGRRLPATLEGLVTVVLSDLL